MNARTTDELAGRFLFHLTLQFMIEASIHAGEVLYLAGSATENPAATFNMSKYHYKFRHF
jgi:hypothetical protein